MMLVTKFQTGYKVDDSQLQPGDIFRKEDDSLWEVTPEDEQVALGSGGSGPVQVATVNLSSAQILALHDTPVTLVVGQAGKMLVPTLVTITATDGDYTVSDPPVFQYPSANQTCALSNMGNVLSGGAGAQAGYDALPTPDNNGFSDTAANLVGTDLQLTAASNPAGGIGTAVLTVYYLAV